MDRFHTPKRVQSLKRHATYARQICRDGVDTTHVRGDNPSLQKPGLTIVTEAAVRKGLIQIMQNPQERTADAADKVLECLDTVLYPKAAERPFAQHEAAVNEYPITCITVLPEETDLQGYSQHVSPKQRKMYSAMHKFNKHIKQGSLNTLPARKSTGDGKPTYGRSKSWTRFSRALILKKASSADTQRSPRRKSSTASSTNNQSANFHSLMHGSFSLAGIPDPFLSSSTATSSPTSDVEDYHSFRSYQVPPATRNPPRHQQRQNRINCRDVDSAYFSDSQKSVESLSPNKYYLNDEDIATVNGKCSSANVQTSQNLIKPPPFRLDFVSSPLPGRKALGHTETQIHSPQWPSNTSNSQPLKPRLQTQCFLSADNISCKSDLSPKPPSPLRERPLLDIERNHRRTFSNGSNTLEITVYMDSEHEDAIGEQKYDSAKESDRTDGVVRENIIPRPLFFHNIVPALREEAESTEAAKMPCKSLERAKKKEFNPAYTPRPNKPGFKLYDSYHKAESRKSAHIGPYLRDQTYDPSSAKGFGCKTHVQSSIVKSLLQSSMILHDAAVKDPLEEALEKASKYRSRSNQLMQNISDTLDKMMKDRDTRGEHEHKKDIL
ncbi:uncharacterized protein PV09_02060 [Verruconis gallopava]|uniref:Uncharacterized protein n=1 Tax=Verruconis gallopava TaxID=253628 RepID=A0A0D2B7G3_9PEZI|nr:uncharacterized protein PV09_02060 [Verruconis gallopava]KIW07194.1 hypothetical protein PV09_02060 [Verruconis gallopava]